MFVYFPKEATNWTIAHVVVVNLLSELAHTCAYVGNFAIILKICDKRVSGIYITLLATLSNLSYFIHKTYIFTVVDYFGLFVPQIVLMVLSFGFLIVLRKKILKMDDEPKENWWVSDKVLKKAQKVA